MSEELLKVVAEAGKLMSSTNEGRDLFERLKKGELTEDQAAQRFLQLIQRDGRMGEMVTAARKLSNIAAESMPLMTETSTGVSQLNPLYEAALAERAFFDGDVPQLRSGPIPEGGSPAVPVLTDVLDPVVVGEMLERASGIVSKRLEAATQEHADYCNQALALAVDSGTTGTELELVKKSLPAKPNGVPGYHAGEEPSKMELLPLDAGAIATLTPETARAYAFKVLTSTQGRVSMVRPLMTDLVERFEEAGVEVEGDFAGDWGIAPDSLSVSWAMVAVGPEDLSERFNFAAVAARSMFEDLCATFREQELSGEYVLTVLPFNSASDRRFGWSAHLNRKED